MTTSINTLPRLRTVATRNDVADLAVVHAFGEGNLNPGRSYPGRETIADGWDPLSMEGPHRSTWHLTGYRLVGQTSTRAVYVWRFAVNGTSSVKYAAAVVDVSRTPASVVVVHACDYQPAEETTRTGAEEKAAAVLAELRAKDDAAAAHAVPTTGPERTAARCRELAAIDAGDRHGVPHQLNVSVLDVDSEVTSYGAHNRLIVMGECAQADGTWLAPQNTVTIREDLRGLPLSTEEDRQRVARGWQRMHPKGTRLVHQSTSEPWTTPGFGDAIEHVYLYTR